MVFSHLTLTGVWCDRKTRCLQFIEVIFLYIFVLITETCRFGEEEVAAAVDVADLVTAEAVVAAAEVALAGAEVVAAAAEVVFGSNTMLGHQKASFLSATMVGRSRTI